MLNLSRNSNSFGTVSERFPKDDKGIYNQLYGKVLAHHERLVEDIYKTAVSPVVFPVGTDLIENYLTGFKLRYIPFDKTAFGLQGVEGFWEQDDRENGVINIFYSQNTNINRQHFTKIHETIHFCQFLDSDLREFIDDIMLNNVLPKEMIEKLIERITEKTAATYLMPKEQTVKKYQENKNVIQLAKEFKVSVKTAIYRLNECGIMVPSS